MFTTYILFSKLRNEYYVGHSEEIADRLKIHNNGESKSTKHGVPWDVIWKYEFTTRGQAILLENKI